MAVELTQADLYSMQKLLASLNEFSREYGDCLMAAGQFRFELEGGTQGYAEYMAYFQADGTPDKAWRVML